MPMYTYICRTCSEQEDLFMRISERKAPICPVCEEPMKQDFSAMRLGVVTHCLGYTTSDISGRPVHVSTLKQERALCEQNGVRRVSSDEIHVSKPPPLSPTEPIAEAFARKKHAMGAEF